MIVSPKRHIHIIKISFALLAVAAVVTVGAFYVTKMSQVNASRLGTPQVTLNPGGGILDNASDGLRFTINLDGNYDVRDYDNGQEGQDGVVYRGTRQYCCSGGGPMLNIGGTLYGQTGPAGGADNWSSIEIISTSGVASIGARTSATGDSSATVRYTVERNGRTYIMDRTVSYYFPNDFVTDSYSFVIPSGNTDQVKFYIGGDTAPGSSDSGYGIAFTNPVRTIISLNTYSQIMFGFREIQGSRPFSGATSQDFYNPYDDVQDGNDIGFVEQANNHDAGLMMQWNLGSSPGTYRGAFEQFATTQGTNLNATLAESFSEVAGVVDLNISIANSRLNSVSGLGYTMTLPANLVIEDTASSTCGGTLTAAVGTGVITLSGVMISAATNCVVSLPVTSSVPGSYTVNSSNVSNLQGAINNNVGVSTLFVGVYQLAYATQGGTPIAAAVAEQGSVITIPSATRAGYIFLGWNTAPNNSGTAYAAGASYTIPANNSTLYAQWQSIPYDLTYDSQGGSAFAPVEDIIVGTEIELGSDPTRPGYAFNGWTVASNGTGTRYFEEDIFTMPAGNTTLYANWAQQVTVRFEFQYDNDYEQWSELTGETFYTLYGPGRDGYDFIEWNTKRDGTGTAYETEEEIAVPSVNTTYYAIWEDKDGVPMAEENAAPNGGDANNDGFLDSQQANVTSFISPVTGKPVTLAAESANDECFLSDVSLVAGSSVSADPAYTYPVGLIDFKVACGDPGFTATIKQYFYDAPANNFILRKLANGQYATVNDATFSRETIDGRQVLVATYDVTDGGPLDDDGLVNGEIIDPAGPAAAVVAAPNTGAKAAPLSIHIIAGLMGIAAILFSVLSLRKLTLARER